MTSLLFPYGQIDNHSRGGAPRWGCCGYRPAHRQGRVHVGTAGRRVLISSEHFCLIWFDLPDYHLAGRFGVRSLFGNFISVRGGNRSANFHGPRHDFPSFVASQLPHFKVSVSVAFKPSDGAIGIDQNPIGASQNVNDC